MKTQNLFYGVAIAAMLSLAGIEANADNMTAAEFVKKASVAGEFEVATSKLALDKSQDKDVKRFAQMMIEDHTQANETLKQTIQAAALPVKPAVKLDEEHQKKFNELQALSSDAFDEKYLDIQEDAHEDAVKLFNNYAQYGDNKDLKQFAQDTLPTLRAHLKHVEGLE